jgi:capsular exopolysaccharide synthesis family protein
MSYIFDALRHSESERTGIELSRLSEATELLEIAEQAAVKRAGVTSPDLAVTRETSLKQEELSKTTVSPFLIPSKRDVRADQFPHFQSCRLSAPPQSKVVCLTEKESLAAEKFRFLGVRLRQLQQHRPVKKILITSTIPEEGKSTVTANLACALAQRVQQKTLLVEGDLRRPSLTRLFGLGNPPGIGEWLHGDRDALGCIHNLEDASLWMLPAGNIATNPLELMQSTMLSTVMDQLSAWFDWIVIDSSPVLPLADTSIWMRYSDGILLVTRPGISQKRELKKGMEAIDSAKLLGAILNGAADAARTNYYYQYIRPMTKVGVRPTK